jgi:hypothetical protein
MEEVIADMRVTSPDRRTERPATPLWAGGPHTDPNKAPPGE